MEFVTIGEFSKRTGLSVRALRLYDELGLFKPATVDPQSGYRMYDPVTGASGAAGPGASGCRRCPA